MCHHHNITIDIFYYWIILVHALLCIFYPFILLGFFYYLLLLFSCSCFLFTRNCRICCVNQFPTGLIKADLTYVFISYLILSYVHEMLYILYMNVLLHL